MYLFLLIQRQCFLGLQSEMFLQKNGEIRVEYNSGMY